MIRESSNEIQNSTLPSIGYPAFKCLNWDLQRRAGMSDACMCSYVLMEWSGEGQHTLGDWETSGSFARCRPVFSPPFSFSCLPIWENCLSTWRTLLSHHFLFSCMQFIAYLEYILLSFVYWKDCLRRYKGPKNPKIPNNCFCLHEVKVK